MRWSKMMTTTMTRSLMPWANDTRTMSGRIGAVAFLIASVMEPCCLALGRMTFNNADNRIKAGIAGAIECVVAAMCAHADNADVQKLGCFALNNMTFDNADNKIKAGSAGAVECVVAAMRAHAGDGDVQEVGRILLDSL